MKFLNINIYNFRILRDVSVKFSCDEVKKLTVIRAQNDSGKTTLLTALQWVLYGESVLPNKGNNYRLHPIDWDSEKSPLVKIEVCLEFKNEHFRKIGQALHKYTRVFRLERSVDERLEGINWERYNEEVKLSELIDGVFKQVLRPESLLEDILPMELREVFFTDGDRALSFIEAGVSAQRKQVESAVKSLLGLSIVESAISHLKTQTNKFDKQFQNVSNSSTLLSISEKIDSLEKQFLGVETDLIVSSEKLKNIEDQLVVLEKKIYETLRQGDKGDLQKRMISVQASIRKNNLNKKDLENTHSKLFQNEMLPLALVNPFIKKAENIIEGLHGTSRWSARTLSIMEQLLKEGKNCLCGESLCPDSDNGNKRRAYIKKILDEASTHSNMNRDFSELRVVLKQKSRESLAAKDFFHKAIQTIYEGTIEINDELNEKMLEEHEIRKKIGLIQKIDLSGSIVEQKTLLRKRDELRIRVDRLELLFSRLKKELYRYETEKRELIKHEKINLLLWSNFHAASDVFNVFLNTYSSIIDTQLKKVSDTMNIYFMEMISGGCVNDNAIIVRAEITDKFDIKVYGPGDRPLSPDKDLNGASRRALTLSLILSLTTVSGVEAPNIIDTPLGMMSGHVKEYVVERVVKYSAQPILFLTRSEIAGCEAILEKYTGEITTFSNPSHYPNSLKNKLNTLSRQIFTCQCKHDQFCGICERVGDEEKMQLTHAAT